MSVFTTYKIFRIAQVSIASLGWKEGATLAVRPVAGVLATKVAAGIVVAQIGGILYEKATRKVSTRRYEINAYSKSGIVEMEETGKGKQLPLRRLGLRPADEVALIVNEAINRQKGKKLTDRKMIKSHATTWAITFPSLSLGGPFTGTEVAWKVFKEQGVPKMIWKPIQIVDSIF